VEHNILTTKIHNEYAVKWLWETFWLNMIITALNIFSSGQCLSTALNKNLLTLHVILLMGIWCLLFSLIFRFLINQIRERKLWPIYLIIANAIVGIMSIILFLITPRDAERNAPSIADFMRSFNLSATEAQTAVEAFKTCLLTSHTTFLEYLSIFNTSCIIGWTLYAAYVLMNEFANDKENEA
jgi:hypothetical protein